MSLQNQNTKKVIMSLHHTISQYWEKIQGTLFPFLEEVLPPLTQKQQHLIAILEVLRIEEYLPSTSYGYRGRPEKSRKAILRAFIAKAVYNMPTTRMVIERLHSDISLRRICGYETRAEIPSESVFSRAFAKVSQTNLLNKIHETIIKTHYEGEVIEHLITDASAITGREKGKKKCKKKKVKIPVGKRRIDKQAAGELSVEEMVADLPKESDIGAKKNTKGNLTWWVGYKLHMTTDDRGIPLAAILSSASLDDTQAAIPLAKLTEARVTGLYDLMDGGYYAHPILEHSKSLGRVPIIDKPAERGKAQEKKEERKAWRILKWKPVEMERYEKRRQIESTFGRLKEEYGGRNVRVRGHAKVYTHLMLGILALTIDQLLRI